MQESSTYGSNSSRGSASFRGRTRGNHQSYGQHPRSFHRGGRSNSRPRTQRQPEAPANEQNLLLQNPQNSHFMNYTPEFVNYDPNFPNNFVSYQPYYDNQHVASGTTFYPPQPAYSGVRPKINYNRPPQRHNQHDNHNRNYNRNNGQLPDNNEKESRYVSSFKNQNSNRQSYTNKKSPVKHNRQLKNGGATNTTAELKEPIKQNTNSKVAGDVEKNEPEAESEIYSMKERMIEQLSNGSYECMVCCEAIRQTSPIWSCSNCFHCFHMYCIKKWAQCDNSAIQHEEKSGWRCPACQNAATVVPGKYKCFCTKKFNPWWNRRDVPHTCGEICRKPLKGASCPHLCSDLCHPGPCEACTLTVTMKCECGKSEQVVRCGQKDFTVCHEKCDKFLNCKVHTCTNNCHSGDCEPCLEKLTQSCFCGKSSREVECSVTNMEHSNYSCHSICDKLLSCEFHKCEQPCHEGPCQQCQLAPDLLTHCPCGKKLLEDIYSDDLIQPRTACSQPVPSCGQVCNKLLICGSDDDEHRCKEKCHEGKCPVCPLESFVDCQCGFQTQKIQCSERESKNVLCNKRCNKKLSCKRHKCLNICCIEAQHECVAICGKKLSCGIHNCDEICHRGDCHTCWQVSFNELQCHCGNAVIFPPIPCGTKPPECNEMCARVHSCEHSVQHNCHSDPECPPCTFLTSKWCYGKHELRKSVPCYLEYVSCGRICGKSLACSKHKCLKTCHSGPCESEPCKQLCTDPREGCGHPCNQVCHVGTDLPPSPCKYKVMITCECKRKKERITCLEYSKLYISASKVALKVNDIRSGNSVNLKEFNGAIKRLECDSDCAIMQRNQQLALALQIENPDMSSKLGPPQYTDWLKEQTRSNLLFVTDVCDKLTKLVILAKDSKQKSRSNAFPAIKRDFRRVIHELSEYYGCESQSVDNEPSRTVIVTAVKDKCWIPSTSIITVVQREMGIRKIPPPVLASSRTPVLKPL